jgi:hypothetical protein
VSLVSVVCCKVEVSASGGSRIQKSPTECGVCVWGGGGGGGRERCEALITRRPWPCAM